MFQRTGTTIDVFYQKPKYVQDFMIASMIFTLERENEERKAIEAKANRK